MWRLTKGSLVVAKGKKEGSLYFIQGKLCKGELNVAYDNANLELWHRRLGHMSEKGWQIPAKKELIRNTKGKLLEPCIDCLAGKQHRVAFHKNFRPTRRKHILDLVHSDVCSLIEKSLGGAF